MWTEEIFNSNKSIALSEIQSIVKDKMIAEDICQDLFLGFLEKDIVITGTGRSFIKTCAKNKALDYIRAKDNYVVDIEGWEEFISYSDDADLKLKVEELRHVLLLLMERLSKNELSCIKKKFFEKKKTGEIAKELNLKRPTVTTTIRKGILKMRDIVKQPSFFNKYL